MNRAFFTPRIKPGFKRPQQPFRQVLVRLGGKGICHDMGQRGQPEEIACCNAVPHFRNAMRAQYLGSGIAGTVPMPIHRRELTIMDMGPVRGHRGNRFRSCLALFHFIQQQRT